MLGLQRSLGLAGPSGCGHFHDQGSAPHPLHPWEGWEFCHENFSLPWYWTQGLGRGFPVCDMGPSSA